jgi:hypothetical protein
VTGTLVVVLLSPSADSSDSFLFFPELRVDKCVACGAES